MKELFWMEVSVYHFFLMNKTKFFNFENRVK